MQDVNLSIVIPAFNESLIIVNNIDELSSWLNSNLSEISYEIIVVDDGSTDNMGILLDDASYG
ncbi:glycosyltransferase [Legionella londiniensis]|uniref:N-glycosyltransferase n=1 Tax=Legionella londiniensis TaxID=45068 RepID=A0A0W0VIY3_9GAMM|nr:glycosyltransferase [Legionella londiniensis]KTD19853.1 N-glycosyltransferase [Legionella londiniensis]STX93537.1 Predicted glycosyl hydrolase [Legionella londiniensis]